MPETRRSVTVDPVGRLVRLTITGGTIYESEGGARAVTFPVVLDRPTTFHIADSATYTVSALVENGAQIATAAGTTATFTDAEPPDKTITLSPAVALFYTAPVTVYAPEALAEDHSQLSGHHYDCVQSPSTSTGTPTLSRINALPVTFLYPWTVVAIGAIITTAGAAANVLRFGIYADNGSDAPGDLIIDAGTVDAVGATPNALASVAVTPVERPAGRYFFGFASQVGTGCVIQTYSSSFIRGSLGTAAPTNVIVSGSHFVSGVTGAFPTPFGTPTRSSTIYRLIYKLA